MVFGANTEGRCALKDRGALLTRVPKGPGVEINCPARKGKQINYRLSFYNVKRGAIFILHTTFPNFRKIENLFRQLGEGRLSPCFSYYVTTSGRWKPNMTQGLKM